MALSYDNDLLFSVFGAGQGRSSIIWLDLQAGKLRKVDGLVDHFLIGIGHDGHNALLGYAEGESVKMYLTDLAEPPKRIQIAQGNFMPYMRIARLVLAFASAPGVAAPFDADEWKKSGLYISARTAVG